MSAASAVGMGAFDQSGSSSWRFACPICRNTFALRGSMDEGVGDTALRCARCAQVYKRYSEIWRFLPDELLARYEHFLREYQVVRRNQGWGRSDPSYFVALPYVASGDPQRAIWRRRSESWLLLYAKIIEPMEARFGRPLRILDLGAGNCWLTYRLTELGHQVAAIDLSLDDTDGLGAHVWYHRELARAGRPAFTSIQADFDRLPLADQTVDIAIFNASLHYSTEYRVTLREALRVVSSKGALVIMDSPVYRDSGSGEQMVRERESAFERTYGFRSDRLPTEQFLTWTRLEELARDLHLHWQVYAPAGRLGSSKLSTPIRGRWRRLRGLRELAMLPVVGGYRI